MKVDIETIDSTKNIVLLRITGKVKVGYLKPIEEAFERLAILKAAKLILDVQNIDTIDSSGIGEFIKGRTRLTDGGGNVVLLGSGSRVEMMMKLSGLANYFPVAENQEQAIVLVSEPPQRKAPESTETDTDSTPN